MPEVLHGGKQTLVEGESCGGEEPTRFTITTFSSTTKL